ncbi:MAG: peptide-methionine (S)-S-oxide reductase MsrA [Hyphomicrobiaceae bacterium]
MLRKFIMAVSALWIATGVAAAQPAPKGEAPKTETATFAGGCFWCVEADLDKVEGVISTTSGFMGGTTKKPTYRQVTAGGTGHLEVVQVVFDPKKLSYRRLLDKFWHSIDPYDARGQFCDKGDSYKTAIFTHTPEQKNIATASLESLKKNGPLKEPVATVVRDAGDFTAAEDYHQDYYKKNPFHYAFYRHGCGRDARVEQIWGKKVMN